MIYCLYIVLILARKRGQQSVLRQLSPYQITQKNSISGIFSVGVPSAVTTLLFDLDYVVIDKLMSAYDSVSLAAIGVVLKVERLPLNIGVGICQGMMPIVAYNYAQHKIERFRETKQYSLKLGLACAAVSIVLYELFTPQIIRLFIPDPATVSIGTTFLRVRILATPLMFVNFVHVHLFNGFGKGGYAFFLGVTRWLFLNIPMLFILNHFFGKYGIVWSQLCADCIMAVISLIVYNHFEKRVLLPEANKNATGGVS